MTEKSITDNNFPERIKIPVPVVVEGKYDKARLSGIIDAQIITTDGFGIFSKSEKLALIKALGKNGIVLLCDSDGAGGVIRRYIMSALDPEKVYNLYIPKIEGKEKRKKEPSKEGTLGVEGIDNSILRELFTALLSKLEKENPAEKSGSTGKEEKIIKADFYALGLTGGKNSKEARDRVSGAYSLPSGMTAGALLGALNILTCKTEFLERAERGEFSLE